LNNCKVYLNPSATYGLTDELVTAVHFAKAGYGFVFGLQIQGGVDTTGQYKYVYGGTTTNATILGTGIPGTGTLKNATSVFDQIGLRKVNINPTLVALDGAAATTREIEISTAGVSRWLMGSNNTAEGGSDAGSDFNIKCRKDDGTALYTPMTITRSSGYLTFGRVPTFADNTAALAGGLTSGQVYRKGGGDLMITY
jgi:hypothetical protein